MRWQQPMVVASKVAQVLIWSELHVQQQLKTKAVSLRLAPVVKVAICKLGRIRQQQYLTAVVSSVVLQLIWRKQAQQQLRTKLVSLWYSSPHEAIIMRKLWQWDCIERFLHKFWLQSQRPRKRIQMQPMFYVALQRMFLWHRLLLLRRALFQVLLLLLSTKECSWQNWWHGIADYYAFLNIIRLIDSIAVTGFVTKTTRTQKNMSHCLAIANARILPRRVIDARSSRLMNFWQWNGVKYEAWARDREEFGQSNGREDLLDPTCQMTPMPPKGQTAVVHTDS
jgi:hypothetical protein